MAGRVRASRNFSLLSPGIILNYVIDGFLIILVYLFSQDILSWFITSENTLNIAHSLLMITLWSYLIFGHAQIITATMRASGTVLWPTVFGIVSVWFVEVPVAYWLSHFSNLGIKGIWVGYPAAFLVSLVLQYSWLSVVMEEEAYYVSHPLKEKEKSSFSFLCFFNCHSMILITFIF